MKEKVAIAGATGFIGRWFIQKFQHKYDIIALSRRKMLPEASSSSVEWRQVELYSLSSTEAALQGADYAIYLVHSMQPSTRLNQGSFDDTDVLLADNFRRAAEQNNLKQIIFLGGILPKQDIDFSRHLRSRYEVEQTLSNGPVPLTALRAGIIVGPGGSSFEIIEKLVRRLPAMLCPQWTLSKSQPIGIEDTLQMVDHCLGNAAYYDEAFDIGGPDAITYVDMMRTVARLLGKKRYITTVPIFSLGLSKLWVATFTDSSTTLVSPLVESLRHELLVRPNRLMEKFPDRVPFEEAVKRALFEKDTVPSLPVSEESVDEERNTVRSVQRLPNPGNHSAVWVARRYQTWLPRFFRYLLRVKQEGETSTFEIAGIPLLQLQFIKDRSDMDRQLFYIVGGRLVKRKDYGWLEFRRVLGGRYFIAAIHEFVPMLPWFVYVLSQAMAHLFVMHQFGQYLKRVDR
jgi:uncharacterized protein YbjT (DUF2867 family)